MKITVKTAAAGLSETKAFLVTPGSPLKMPALANSKTTTSRRSMGRKWSGRWPAGRGGPHADFGTGDGQHAALHQVRDLVRHRELDGRVEEHEA